MALERGVLHEAQAACALEAFGAVQYAGRSGSLASVLLARLQTCDSLPPHTLSSVMRGLAQLRMVPPAPFGVSACVGLLKGSQLQLDWSEAATVLWSLVELDQADVATELLAGIESDLFDASGSPDAQSTCTFLWALLAIGKHASPLLEPLVAAARGLQPGGLLPAQLCMLAESMLMLQLEAPNLAVSLPTELVKRARLAWQAQQQRKAAEPPPTLVKLHDALEYLQLKHGINVFNHYAVDAVVPQEVSGGSNLALLLQPLPHYTSARGLLGSVQIRSRLLAKLGFVVIDVSHEVWEDAATDDQRVATLRSLLSPHIAERASAPS